MTNSIELDFSYELNFGELQQMCDDYQLTPQIVEINGPAGGNPLIQLMGDKSQIISFLKNVYTVNTDDFADYLPFIK